MSATRAYELCCMQLSIAGAYFRLGMRELLPRPAQRPRHRECLGSFVCRK